MARRTPEDRHPGARADRKIHFSRVEPFTGTRWIDADAETKGVKAERVVVSFGPEDAPLEQRQVERPGKKLEPLFPSPPCWSLPLSNSTRNPPRTLMNLMQEKTKLIFLKVQMNTDLLTEDLEEARRKSELLAGGPA